MEDLELCLDLDTDNDWYYVTDFLLANNIWNIRGHSLSLNAKHPHAVHYMEQCFPLLSDLAKAYVEIDRLNSNRMTIRETTVCSTSAEAIGYIIRFNEVEDTINRWLEHMLYIEEELLILAPDFTQWDANTQEMETLANQALTLSKRVLRVDNHGEMKLPDEVVHGISVRTRMLESWTTSHLQTVRAREDYIKWKAEKDAPTPPLQLRNRRGYPMDGAATTTPTTTISTPLDAPKPYRRSSKPRGMELYFQSDLTIWSLNLAIYLTCTILQATSTSRQQSSSPPDYLAATQATLTQVLSVIMTYILTIRNDRDCNLGIAYRLWFCAAAVLPLVGLGVLRWNAGVSALVMFLGTAVTGVLQVLLAVYMKRAKVLPS